MNSSCASRLDEGRPTWLGDTIGFIPKRLALAEFGVELRTGKRYSNRVERKCTNTNKIVKGQRLRLLGLE